MENEKKDYSKTVNLPKTDFQMKANLAQREPDFLKELYDAKIYEKMRAKNQGKKKFILHDGPPYANGNMHSGHALNKILKDFILKYKNMKGFDTPYTPGWDCHLQKDSFLYKEKVLKDWEYLQIGKNLILHWILNMKHQ